MPEYACVTSDMRIRYLCQIDDDLWESWRESGNPKADSFLPVIETGKPNYDPSRQALVQSYDVGLANVVRIWSIRQLTDQERRRTWTSLEFLSRFDSTEMESIETARAEDPIVQSFYRAALAAQEVVNDDPRTVAGMDYLVTIGILTNARRDAILG